MPGVNHSAPLLLVAAGGLAHETLALIRGQGVHNLIGFLDDDPDLIGATIEGLPVLGLIEDVTAFQQARLLVCAGKGGARESIVRRLNTLGVGQTRYVTIVHPSVEVPAGCAVGMGTILLAGVVLTAAVSIGDHVVVMPNATLTHDCVLEDYATICAGVALGGNVTVQRGAFVGMNASVREGASVGAGATLGMGSVLLHDLPAREIWAGVPAAPLSTGKNDMSRISFGRA
jgi:sugar O-acyltransferase (sialic acid O-acetyltransferase NeuD family)